MYYFERTKKHNFTNFFKIKPTLFTFGYLCYKNEQVRGGNLEFIMLHFTSKRNDKFLIKTNSFSKM